ncbi:RNA polymerase sigma factor [Lacipirellula sp.]|uniref:RNA polymerase sigma factor n=1 Tax=Lacipirellula sp. TaxID=2691419 RepID=UPI003D12420D
MTHDVPDSPNDDDALLVRARTDREAFGELCDRCYPPIFRYCRRRLFRWDDAEEVTAEVFLNVARSMHGFCGGGHRDFMRWVYAIAANQVNAHLRKSERRDRLLLAAAQNGAVNSSPEAKNVGSFAALEWPSVYQSLLRLSLRDQSIVVLRYFESMPHRQIAEILRMRPGAVRTAEMRAIEKLRRDLGVIT